MSEEYNKRMEILPPPRKLLGQECTGGLTQGFSFSVHFVSLQPRQSIIYADIVFCKTEALSSSTLICEI